MTVINLRNNVTATLQNTSNENLRLNSTQYGQLISAQEKVFIELKSPSQISILRDISSSVSGGYVTNYSPTGEIQLTTSAVANSRITFSSAQRGRYMPGTIAEAGIGLRIPTAPSGGQEYRWGYYDESDGFYLGYNSGGLFSCVRTSGSETRKYRNSWAGDKLDGTGPTGISASLNNGSVFKIQFERYGYGAVEFSSHQMVPSTLETIPVLMDRFKISGSTVISKINLPIRTEILNNGTAQAGSMFISGRKFSLYGQDFNFSERYSTHRMLSVVTSTTSGTLISFRKKAEKQTEQVKINHMEIVVDGNIIWELRLSSTITGGAWESPVGIPSSETAVEFNLTGAADNGITIYSGFASSGKNDFSLTDVGLPTYSLIDQYPVSLVVRSITGTPTVSAVIILKEEW